MTIKYYMVFINDVIYQLQKQSFISIKANKLEQILMEHLITIFSIFLYNCCTSISIVVVSKKNEQCLPEVQNNFGQNQTFLSEKSIWALHSPKLSRPAQNILTYI